MTLIVLPTVALSFTSYVSVQPHNVVNNTGHGAFGQIYKALDIDTVALSALGYMNSDASNAEVAQTDLSLLPTSKRSDAADWQTFIETMGESEALTRHLYLATNTLNDNSYVSAATIPDSASLSPTTGGLHITTNAFLQTQAGVPTYRELADVENVVNTIATFDVSASGNLYTVVFYVKESLTQYSFRHNQTGVISGEAEVPTTGIVAIDFAYSGNYIHAVKFDTASTIGLYSRGEISGDSISWSAWIDVEAPGPAICNSDSSPSVAVDTDDMVWISYARLNGSQCDIIAQESTVADDYSSPTERDTGMIVDPILVSTDYTHLIGSFTSVSLAGDMFVVGAAGSRDWDTSAASWTSVSGGPGYAPFDVASNGDDVYVVGDGVFWARYCDVPASSACLTWDGDANVFSGTRQSGSITYVDPYLYWANDEWMTMRLNTDPLWSYPIALRGHDVSFPKSGTEGIGFTVGNDNNMSAFVLPSNHKTIVEKPSSYGLWYGADDYLLTGYINGQTISAYVLPGDEYKIELVYDGSSAITLEIDDVVFATQAYGSNIVDNANEVKAGWGAEYVKDLTIANAAGSSIYAELFNVISAGVSNDTSGNANHADNWLPGNTMNISTSTESIEFEAGEPDPSSEGNPDIGVVLPGEPGNWIFNQATPFHVATKLRGSSIGTIISNSSESPQMEAVLWAAFMSSIAMGFFALFGYITRSAIIAAVAGGCIIAISSKMGVYPVWTLFVYSILASSILVVVRRA